MINNKKLKIYKDSIKLILESLLLFIFSMSANYYTVLYASRMSNNTETDILLNNLPVINTDWIFSEGALIFSIFVFIVLILRPSKISFTVKSLALFIFIRSCFVSMTHLAPPLGHIVTDWGSYSALSAGSDLFFSGHTGIPFLLALIFWKEVKLRYIFLLSTVIGGTAVILGHLHYTIDVMSAIFITYTIWHISEFLFKKDFELFKTIYE